MIPILSLDMNINDCPVTLEFRMIQDEPDWETFKVIALLPSATTEAKHWVVVNDLLSEKDWINIEYEIGWNHEELVRQAHEHDY